MAINEKESILKLSLQDDEPSATGTPALRRGSRETWEGEQYLSFIANSFFPTLSTTFVHNFLLYVKSTFLLVRGKTASIHDTLACDEIKMSILN